MPTNHADQVLRRQRANAYPVQIWYFLACFISLVAIFQLASRVYSCVFRKQVVLANGADLQISSRRSPSSCFIRIPISILNAYRITMFRISFHINMLGSPYTFNLAEVVVTMVYIATISAWALINTTNLEGKNFDYQYWGNRAGSIAASQFPLITVLGTKNNVIGLVTGISYEKLNFVHRMTSRVVFVLIWMHGSNRLALNGVDSQGWLTVWLRSGIMAAVAVALLVVVSLRPVRTKRYGLFFWVHFTMVLIALVGTYIHTRTFNFQKYIWPCFVVLGLDRLIRAMRIGFFSLSSGLFSFKQSCGEAKCEVISDDILRLTVPQPPHFHWHPGQHVNIIIPGAFRYLLHPFTIATLDRSVNGANGTSVSDKEKGMEESEGKSTGMQFFINVRSGSTRRLAGLMSRENLSTVKMFVDGPYGSPPRLGDFHNCVFVAGGTGVAFTLPLFLDMIEKVQEVNGICRRLVFIWTTRDIKNLKLVSDTISSAVHRAPSSLSVDVRLHVTSGSDASNSESEDGLSVKDIESNASPSLTELESPHIHLYWGRPELSEILPKEIEVTRGGKLSVNVCGSDSITRSVRSTLRMGAAGPASIMKGGASVSLFVESFGWA